MKHLLPLFILILCSCSQTIPLEELNLSGQIRINQLGYFPSAIKDFVVADLDANSFTVYTDQGKKVYEGTTE